MGENSAELSLDLGSIYAPRTISGFLRDVSTISRISDSEKSSKLNGCVRKLEDELRKIQNLKTELPLCMLLLNDAIMKLKEDTMQCQRTEDRPATGGFTPLMKGNSGKGETSSDFGEKKAWLSSAQLWISTGNVKCESSHPDINKRVSADFDLKWREKKDDHSATESRFQACNFRNIGGAFVPFKPQVSLIQGLSLSAPVGELGSLGSNLEGNRGSVGSGSSSVTTQQMINHQLYRPNYGPKKLPKRRRCWSPELHRRFVDALEQLGGPQSATPKHIRDLMKVDSITNDEVKSHLQIPDEDDISVGPITVMLDLQNRARIDTSCWTICSPFCRIWYLKRCVKYRIHFRKLHAFATRSASTSTTSLLMSPIPSGCGYELKANTSESGSPPSPFRSAESAKGVSTITHSDSIEQEGESREP